MYCEGLTIPPTKKGRCELCYVYGSLLLLNIAFLFGHFHDFVAWQLHYTK